MKGFYQTMNLYFPIYEPQHVISNNVICATSKGSDQPAHTRSLIRAFASTLEYYMTLRLLTEHNLEFISLKGGCTGSSESTLAGPLVEPLKPLETFNLVAIL